MTELIGHVIDDPPYHYDKGDEVTVVFRTDRAVVASVLPPVLSLPEGEAYGVLRAVHHRRSTFGPYVGVYLSVRAELEGKPVLYGITGMKTTFTGVIAGREIWGMPLQTGEAQMQWDGDVLILTAGRHGFDYVRMVMRLGVRTDPPASLGMLTYATRLNPFEPEARYGLLSPLGQVFEPAEVQFWSATAVLKLLGGDPGDDWSLLPVLEVVDARYNRGGRSSLDRGSLITEW
ncbi:acetoacetate decarboxylase family protein [Arthrobacter sp. B6]|uniref:acetoacetate decarboxylase family protein n=1 Tax=Arthrobacter sp. B6 TaxID=1570137 RepID=UPI000835E764|nr:acetoacetate decarboxylase family protein [Arthrobacter sp. B6]